MMLSDLKPRSDSALVRNLLPQIEAALARGVSRETVWESLKAEHGLTVSFHGFLRALSRARAKSSDMGGSNVASKVDCAIQADSNDKPQAKKPAKVDRRITPKTFDDARQKDFSNLVDDKY